MHHTDFTRYAAHLQELFDYAPARLPSPERTFDSLARELLSLQYAYNEPFHKLCAARGIQPETLRSWRDIPAMPTSSFKEFDVTCILPGERRTWFESSGTTGTQPSRHYHGELSLRIYEASLWAWFAQQFKGVASGYELLVLAPEPALAPHSSLVHMFETVRQKLHAPREAYCASVAEDGAWVLDPLRCRRNLTRIGKKPVLLMGTAFSYVHFLDLPGIMPLRLPRGSLVFETGGYKGRSRSLPRHELHAQLCAFFGVEPEAILCEYGMSELSSQAYEMQRDTSTAKPAASRAFQFPPWARARIISPETGLEVQEGEVGIIEIVDLANITSVLAVRTEDLAVKRGDGFEFKGRAPQAEPRGCSLRPADRLIA